MKYHSIARLEAEMRQMTRQEVEAEVEVGLEKAVHNLYEAYIEPNSNEKKRFCAIQQLGLFAVAKDELQGFDDRSPFTLPRWLENAQKAIEQFAAEDNEIRTLKETAFFGKGYDHYEKMTRVVFPNIVEPHNRTYDGTDFAAAVVCGGIVMMSARERFSAA